MLDDFQDEDMNNSGEFLDEFRQRLNSQPLENLDERRNQVNRSQQIFIGTILGIGLAGLVSWFIFASDYKQNPNVEIPVVRRPQTAVKVQPAEPGGMEILNQDKTVYDIVEKNDTSNNKVESLLPPPEEPNIPLLKEANGAIANSEAPNTIEPLIDDNLQKTAELPPASEIKKPVLKDLKDQNKSKEEVKVTEVKPVEEVKTNDVKPVESVEKQQISQNNVTDKSNDKQSIPNGVWQIQLMSTPNAQAVDKAWIGFKSKYPALDKLPHETEVADLGTKGTYYRLKVGAFLDRGEADKLCNSIKNSGGTCLVKKK